MILENKDYDTIDETCKQRRILSKMKGGLFESKIDIMEKNLILTIYIKGMRQKVTPSTLSNKLL